MDASNDLSSGDLRRIFESLPGCYAVMRSDLTIVLVSDAYVIATRLRREDLVGRKIDEVYRDPPNTPPNGASKVYESLQMVVRQGVSQELQLQANSVAPWLGTKSPPKSWTVLNSPVFDEDGKLVYVVHQLEDLSAERALVASNRRKDEFLEMLGHELRNPLSPLKTALELMAVRIAHDRDLARYAEVMRRQLGRLARVIDDVLDASRLSPGEIELRTEVVNVNRAMQRAIEAARRTIEDRRHELSVRLPARPVRVVGDPVRLDQVFGHLLSNAAKYTEPGGRICVDVWREDGEVIVRVRDTGVGMSPEDLSHVFQPFEQSAHGRTQGGLGIGLTLAKRLVELHRGSIEAKSEGSGQGSEFIVRLPEATEAERQHEEVLQHDTIRETVDNERLKVLVVDDNADAADTLKTLVAHWGDEARAVYDGTQALTAVDEFRPDIVFLDIGLPQMDGYEVASRILSGRPHPPRLVALTGYSSFEDREKSRRVGFSEHLVKPVQVDAVRRILEQSRHH